MYFVNYQPVNLMLSNHKIKKSQNYIPQWEFNDASREIPHTVA